MGLIEADIVRVALAAVLAPALAVACGTDLAWRTIPNRLTLGAASAALALLAWGPAAVAAAHLGWGAGAAVLLGVPALLRPEGMGMGDAKLAGVIGLCLGPAAFVAIALGSLAACSFGAARALPARRGVRSFALPFAPFLAAGCLAAQMLQ